MNDKNCDINASPKLLQCLDAVDHLGLLRLGKRCFIEKNNFAFQAGDPNDSVYLVERGRFKTFQTAAGGKRMLLSCRVAGDLMGLRESLWSHGTKVRTYSAEACEDSEVLAISVSKFMEFIAVQPGLALNIAKILSQRVDDVSEMLTSLAVTNTTSRVAHLILHCYRCYGLKPGNATDIGIPLSQQEIADMAGIARQTVSGIIATFKGQGVLSVTHKHIRIESVSHLNILAHGERRKMQDLRVAHKHIRIGTVSEFNMLAYGERRAIHRSRS